VVEARLSALCTAITEIARKLRVSSKVPGRALEKTEFRQKNLKTEKCSGLHFSVFKFFCPAAALRSISWNLACPPKKA